MAITSEQEAGKMQHQKKKFYLRIRLRSDSEVKITNGSDWEGFKNGQELCVQISTVEPCQEPNAEWTFAEWTSANISLRRHLAKTQGNKGRIAKEC